MLQVSCLHSSYVNVSRRDVLRVTDKHPFRADDQILYPQVTKSPSHFPGVGMSEVRSTPPISIKKTTKTIQQ